MSGLESSAAYRRLGGAYRFRAQLRPGFIFTTALPPAVAAAALAIRLLKYSSIERRQLHERAALLRRRLCRRNSHRDNPTHIAPVIVGDPILCQEISDRLHEEFSIYVQLINYPTVPRGHERLRFTPSPMHTDEMMAALVAALDKVWIAHRLNRAA